MMGIPPSEARALSYWEYTALLAVWNERHGTGEERTLPDADLVDAVFARGSVH